MIKRRLKGTDIADLRDFQGMTLHDTLWLTGSMVPKWKVKDPTLNKGLIDNNKEEVRALDIKLISANEVLAAADDESDEYENALLEVESLEDQQEKAQSAIYKEEIRCKNELDSPYLSIMVRLLMENPDVNILPVYPSAQEMFDLIDAFYPHGEEGYEKFNTRRFAQIMGVSDWAAYNWIESGKEPGPVIKRLFLMIRNLIEGNDYVQGRGEEGLVAYLKIVEQEIIARGVNGGIPGLNSDGGWKGKALNRQSVVKEKIKAYRNKKEKGFQRK